MLLISIIGLACIIFATLAIAGCSCTKKRRGNKRKANKNIQQWRKLTEDDQMPSSGKATLSASHCDVTQRTATESTGAKKRPAKSPKSPRKQTKGPQAQDDEPVGGSNELDDLPSTLKTERTEKTKTDRVMRATMKQ